MTRVMQQKQKDQFRTAAHFARASNPTKTQKTMKTPSTVDFPAIRLRVRFQQTFIDLTGLGTKKGSDNESFLSILESSSNGGCGPLHGNQTPKVSGQPGNGPGAPVPVYGRPLRARKK